ncbi:leucine-rich repeat domain-containing protein, partial [uncultured Ruminococcus sp.]|uniref:leucine-rich repeat domain-containing protein n=1 Tax=uncultured Ruminococcus sp. TaxID=165186 RepID=UPI0026024223
MFKRTIAAVLSAFLCASAVTSGAPPRSMRAVLDSSGDTAANAAASEMKASNSLGRYLDASSSGSEGVKQLSDKKNAVSDQYRISGLEFDKDSGKVRVISTQSSDCTLEVNFFDETTNELVTSVKIPLKKGDFTVNEGMVDKAALPEYFIIRAFLSDMAGTRLSDEYSRRTFTSKVQDIIATDINDFDAERVVNFDDSEKTNFLVLSDDTVKAEISEDSNQLVSADYDNNVFVIGNADDTVKGLEKGQYFYFQPNEKDIIAVAVEEVSTDGDKTTVKGTSDIDEMFRFMKFETTAGLEGAEIDNSARGIGYEYDEAEDRLHFDPDDLAEEIEQEYISYATDGDYGSGSFNFSSSTELSAGALSVTPSISIGVEVSFNYYLDWFYLDVEMSVTTSASFEVSISGEIQVGGLDHMVEIPLFETDIPTSVPGLVIPIELDFVISVSGELTVSFSLEKESGFYFNTDDGLEKIERNDPSTNFTVELSGSVFIGFEFSVGAAIISSKIAKFDIAATAGVEFSGSLSVSISTDASGDVSGDTNIYSCTDLSGDTAHLCGTCIDGDAELVASLGLEVEALDGWVTHTLAAVEARFKLFDWYLSLGSYDPSLAPIDPAVNRNWLSSANKSLIRLGLGECPNIGYKITVNTDIDKIVTTTNAAGEPSEYTTDVTNAVVKINNVELRKVGNTYTCYARPGRYNINVYVDGNKIKTESIVINASAKSIDISATIGTDGYVQTGSPSTTTPDAPAIATTTVTVARPAPVKPTRTRTVPRIIESVKLGDHITGTLYNNGYLHVFGYGDMYNFGATPFKKAATVTQILFEDDAPAKDLVITGIGNHVFDGFTALSSSSNDQKTEPVSGIIVLPEKLTRIGDYAFANCTAVSEFSFGSTLESIGSYAFQNCTGVKELVIPDTVITMGHLMLNGCTSVETLTLPFAAVRKTCTDIDGELGTYDSVSDMFLYQWNSWLDNEMDFSGYSIEKITVTGGEIVPAYAFSTMTTLKEIDLSGTSVQSIGNGAFQNCTSLATVKLPGTVKSLGNYAYSGTAIKSVPDNGAINSAGDYAFSECHDLVKVAVPSTYKSLGAYAFANCANMTELTIPRSVTSMGVMMFNGCTALKTLTMPYAATNKSCTDIEGSIGTYDSVSDMFLYQWNNWLDGELDFSAYSIEKITVTGGETVPSYAFSSMTTLKEIDLSSSKIQSIGDSAFQNCTSLATVKLPKTVKTLGNYAYSGTAIKSVPDNGAITSAGNHAFSDCPNLVKASVPSSYKTLGSSAFSGCANMVDLVIPKSVTSMGELMFNGCTALKTLTMPYAATKRSCTDIDGSIGTYDSVSDMFLYQWNNWLDNELDFSDYSIEKITITGGETVPAYAFSHMTTLKEIDLSSSEIQSIGDHAFHNCTSLATVYLPETTKSLGNYAYFGTAIEFLPDNGTITSAGNYAFSSCPNLVKTTVPSTYKTLGSYAFADCANMVDLVIPKSVTSMGAMMFNGCKALKTLTMPYAATNKSCTDIDGSIGTYDSVSDMFLYQWNNWLDNELDFSGYSIEKITITGGDTVPAYAFSHMTTLKEIDLSSSEIQSIGDSAFQNCTSLATVKLPDTVKTLGNYSFYNTALSALPDNGTITSAGNYSFAECKKLGNISIPKSYKSFGDHAFMNCKGIKKLVIPANVTSLGIQIFNGCTNLADLTLPHAATMRNCTNIDGGVTTYDSVADLFIYQWNNWENNEMDFSPYAISKITITGGDTVPAYAFSHM